MPWDSGAPEFQGASRLKTRDEMIYSVVAGFLDAAGTLQAYLPVGGNVSTLPDPDTETIILPATNIAGGASLVCPITIDMQLWEDLWLDVHLTFGNCAAGEILLELLGGASGDNEMGSWDAGEVASGFRVDNPATISATESFYVRFRACGGNPVTAVRITNGNAAARTFSVLATRFLRRHL